ncbi:WYL domain-containing protein, partial [Flavobacteriales bacterium]|nr:WYL domain-containing protein [Flavobacteriales bacterium]
MFDGAINKAASETTQAMQSHKNQVHRLLLIDRVLQKNTFRQPNGATRESLEASVKKLLTGGEDGIPSSLPCTPKAFDELWKGENAFWRDLNFILTHYPTIMQKEGNKLWSYRDRGMSIFPRFGGTLEDKTIQEAVLLLEHHSSHPMYRDFEVERVIRTLNLWFGLDQSDNSDAPPLFQHQFSVEDAEVLTSHNAQILHACCEQNGRRIVTLQYRSSRTGKKRALEFHPWQFMQSEGRWYVTGFISRDLIGDYPKSERSDYPGLALKIEEVDSVEIIPEEELESRKKNKAFLDNRHTYQSSSKHSALLNMDNRIGIGGWDGDLGQDIQ